MCPCIILSKSRVIVTLSGVAGYALGDRATGSTALREAPYRGDGMTA